MMTKKVTSLIVAMCLALIPGAYAGDFQKGDYQRQGGSQRSQSSRPPQNAGSMLGMALHDTMAMEVLAELTGTAPEAITMERGRGMREYLQANGIDQEAFKTAMDVKMIALAHQAAQCGLLTQAQADSIAEKIQNRPTKRGRPGSFNDPE